MKNLFRKFVCISSVALLLVTLLPSSSFAQYDAKNNLFEFCSDYESDEAGGLTRQCAEYTISFNESNRPEITITRLYSNYTITLNSGTYHDFNKFVADGNYIAFEGTGTLANGLPCSTCMYSVSLRTNSGGTVASVSVPANGGTFKKDWVSISYGSTYYFRVTNNSDQTLRITITYYTW